MKLPEDRAALLVSLPRNDVRLAEAAVAAGADGLKVHANVEHRASGTRFGSFDAEAESLRAILDLGVPVGAVPGAGVLDAEEVRRAAELGIDYVDVYASEAPVDYVAMSAPMSPMLALGPSDHAPEARALQSLGIRALELSTLEPERYGSPLSLATLARLRAVCEAVDIPVIVPSQHRLTPGDVPVLAEGGARGILLGAVVLGDDPASYAERLAPFVEVIRS